MTTSNAKDIFSENTKIKRALISVTDKNGIDELAKKLISFDIEILSTGGTAKFLKEKSIPVSDVSQKNKFPRNIRWKSKNTTSKNTWRYT